MQYQLAFVSSELQEIFAKAPPIPSDDPTEKDGKRRPIEGDCPICCEDFKPGSEEIVYCKAACGNNIHKACFEQWAATKGATTVTCPYCRTPWAGDEEMVKKIVKDGNKNSEGYVNVASQLGLSGERGKQFSHGSENWAACFLTENKQTTPPTTHSGFADKQGTAISTPIGATLVAESLLRFRVLALCVANLKLPYAFQHDFRYLSPPLTEFKGTPQLKQHWNRDRHSFLAVYAITQDEP